MTANQACIILDPDDSEMTLTGAELSRNDSLESDNYKTEVKVLWRSHKLVHLEMHMVRIRPSIIFSFLKSSPNIYPE